MGFCSCTVKFVLFVFNFLCALVGLTVLGVSIWMFLKSSNFNNVLHGEVSATVITMMVLGGVTFVIAFLGCCGAVKEDPCFITTYAILLTVILVGQLVVAGIAVYFFKGKSLELEMKKNLENAFGNYKENKKFIDDMQQEYHCCGYDGPSSVTGDLPPSCCHNPSDVGLSCPRDQAFPKDCRGPALGEMKHALKVIAITLFVIVGVELLCIICAFCVASSIRKEMRSGYSY
uniref:Tetraspanin n=1 Tax=Lygus hesperus TaxID=30085 RepID=A0A0A9YU81_LYGHE